MKHRSNVSAAALTIVVLAALSCPPAEAAELGARRPAAQESSDAEAALARLLEGNVRFTSGKPRHPHKDLLRRALLTRGQQPFAAVLGCADSRVPPEIVFDHGLGDLFVVRVAGNVVSDDEAGSIEYAVAHLDTSLIVVLGHEGCGAVTAALEAPAGHEPEELERLLDRIGPALAGIDRSLPMEERVALGVEANVRHATKRIHQIAQREAPTDDSVLVVGAVYELATGHVRVLESMRTGIQPETNPASPHD